MAFKTYTPTKAQQMRAIAAKIQESGRRPAPKDLIEEMAKRGIEISSGHASTVLRKFTGKRFRTRCNRTTRTENGGHKAVRGERESPALLAAAAKFVNKCGGFKPARARLAVLEELLKTVNPA